MSARANSDTVGSNVTKYAMGYAMTAAQISNILLDLLAEQRSAEADAIAVVRPKSRAGSIGEPTKYPIKQTRIAKKNARDGFFADAKDIATVSAQLMQAAIIEGSSLPESIKGRRRAEARYVRAKSRESFVGNPSALLPASRRTADSVAVFVIS